MCGGQGHGEKRGEGKPSDQIILMLKVIPQRLRPGPKYLQLCFTGDLVNEVNFVTSALMHYLPVRLVQGDMRAVIFSYTAILR